MKNKIISLFCFGACFSLQAQEPFYFSLSRGGGIVTLTKNSEFITRPPQTPSSKKHFLSLSFQGVNSTLKHESSLNYDPIISLSAPSILIFHPNDEYEFEGLLESAGNTLYICPRTTVDVKRGIRLGFNTQNVFYEYPLPLARTHNTYPTFLRVEGTLSLLPGLNHKENTFEFNVCGIIIDLNGSLVVGPSAPSLGWHSSQSSLVLYDSSISAPAFSSRQDQFNIVGAVSIHSKTSSFEHSHIKLGAEDTYHATEWANSFNETCLTFEVEEIIFKKTKISYPLGYNQECEEITFPKVSLCQQACKNIDISDVTISIESHVVEKNKASLVSSLKGKKFILLYSCQALNGMPNLETPTLEGVKMRLSVSKDKHSLFLIIS